VSVRRVRLFLDANILHAAAVRDFVLRLAEAGVVDVRWSGPVLEETRRSLESRGFPADKVDHLINALRTAFPEAEVHDFEDRIAEMNCPDPDDRHVLAAAVAGQVDFLVTDNTDDFPADTGERYDVAVMTGDDVAAFFVRAYPEAAARVGRTQIADLANPPSTENEFLQRVAKTAPRFAIALGAALGIDSWAQLQSDADDASAKGSPHEAVRLLLVDLREGSDDEVWARLHPELQAAALAATSGRRHAAVQHLRDHLAEIAPESWGFGRAKRILAPDTELVKLLRLDEAGPIVHAPTLVQHAHLFRMIHLEGAWLLAGLDEPDPGLQPETEPGRPG
jgi:Predicted nucleic acid-binding protein, contains PIN domain